MNSDIKVLHHLKKRWDKDKLFFTTSMTFNKNPKAKKKSTMKATTLVFQETQEVKYSLRIWESEQEENRENDNGSSLMSQSFVERRLVSSTDTMCWLRKVDAFTFPVVSDDCRGKWRNINSLTKKSDGVLEIKVSEVKRRWSVNMKESVMSWKIWNPRTKLLYESLLSIGEAASCITNVVLFSNVLPKSQIMTRMNNLMLDMLTLIDNSLKCVQFL